MAHKDSNLKAAPVPTPGSHPGRRGLSAPVTMGNKPREMSKDARKAVEYTERLKLEYAQECIHPINAKCKAVDKFWTSKQMSKSDKQVRDCLVHSG